MKYKFQDVLRDTEDHDLAPAICHLFNCLFGNCQAPGGKVIANGTQSRTPKKVFPVWLDHFEISATTSIYSASSIIL